MKLRFLGPALVTACTGTLTLPAVNNGGGINGGGGDAASLDYRPTAVSIAATSTSPTYEASLWDSTTFPAQLGALSVQIDNPAPVGSALTNSGSGSSASGSGVYPSTSLFSTASSATLDPSYSVWAEASNPRSYGLHIDATFPTGASPACSFVGSFSAIPCRVNDDLTLDQVSLAAGDSVAVEAYATNGAHQDRLTSNALPVSRYVFSQVTDTAHDPTVDDYPDLLQAGIGKIFFQSKVGTVMDKLFSFDGTTVRQLTDLRSGSADLIDRDSHTVFQNRFYFTVGYISGGGLFWTDGTELHQVASTTNVFTQIVGQNATDLIFISARSGKRKLYRWNGTDLTPVADILGATHDDFSYDGYAGIDGSRITSSSGFTLFQGSYYFFGFEDDTFHYRRLYSTDLSTGVVKASHFHASNDLQSYEEPLSTVFNNELYFYGRNASGGEKLMAFNGSSYRVVSNTANNLATDDYIFDPPMEFNGKLYFTAYNANTKQKLYRTDGSAVELVASTTGSANTGDLVYMWGVFGGKFYFQAKDSSAVVHLYRTDGLSLELVPNVDAPGKWLVVGDKAYVPMKNSNGKTKIFRFDGTTFVQISNFNGDNADDIATTNNYEMLESGGYVYFDGLNSQGKTKLMRFKLP